MDTIAKTLNYSKFMNMPGAADTCMYLSEFILPPYIEVFSTKETNLAKDYSSYYDSMRSMTLPKI